jgi:hypothetical protein
MRTLTLLRLLVLGAFVLAPAAAQRTQEQPAWQPVSLPDAKRAMAPALRATADGALLTRIVPTARRTFRLELLRFQDGAFGPPREVVTSDTMFTNWADCPEAALARDGSVLVHWLRRAEAHHYGIEVLRAEPEGAFVALGAPHRGGIRGEHGFVSMLPEASGIRLFWLDGRHYSSEKRMELRTALVTGATIGDEHVLDPDVCTCCQTSAVATQDGALVVYRGHTRDEVRDIVVVRQDGDGWSKPARVAEDGWVVPGCPVNGPRAAVAGKAVAVAWYTGAPQRRGVHVACSDDGGRTFGASLRLDDGAIGRVDIAADGDTFVVAWLTPRDDGAALVACTFAPGENPTPPREVARVAADRSAGFPRLAATPQGSLLVWTGRDGVQAALLPRTR